MSRSAAAYDVTSGEYGRVEIAGFGSRLVAFVIDGVIFAVVGVAIVLMFAPALSQGGSDSSFTILNAALTLGSLGAHWIFNSVGWSPGKLMMGLRIVNAEGTAPGAARGFARTAGTIVSSLPLYLGYLWAAWDGRTQTWHDKIAGTYVVRFAP